MKFKKKEKETVKEPKKTPPPRPGGKGAPSRSSKPKRESGTPPSSTPTKSASKGPFPPVDRGNSPLADVKAHPLTKQKERECTTPQDLSAAMEKGTVKNEQQ